MDGVNRTAKQERIWEFFQNDLPESFAAARPRLRYLARHAKPGSRVLNIGVGAGTFEEEALARRLDVYSLDPDEKAILKLRGRLSLGDKAKIGFIEAIPFPDGTFDTVVLSEVVEHLPADVAANGLREVCRVLVPGGQLLGTVPAREKLEASVVACPNCAHVFHRWGHERSYDVASMTAYLSTQLAVERVFERPFVDWSEAPWYQKLATATKMAFRAVGVHAGEQNIVFVARKRSTTQ